MVSKNTTLISVSKNTKENLDKLKLHPSLSYNDVIVGLIKSVYSITKIQNFQRLIEPSIEVDENTTLDEIAEQNQIKPEETPPAIEEPEFTETNTSIGN